MPFYEFRQNNTGGSFEIDGEAGISRHVIIEADHVRHANERAEEIGLYFDGDGDCSCCGDRWYRASSYDSDDVPSIYGKPIEEYYANGADFIEWTDKKTQKDAYVHYLDGRVEGYQYK